MSVIVEFSMFPIGKEGSLSPYVARLLVIIRESGLPHVFGPMSTSVEGEWAQVMTLVDRCHAELARDCERIHIALRADSRRGVNGRLCSKVEHVEALIHPTE